MKDAWFIFVPFLRYGFSSCNERWKLVISVGFQSGLPKSTSHKPNIRDMHSFLTTARLLVLFPRVLSSIQNGILKSSRRGPWVLLQRTHL